MFLRMRFHLILMMIPFCQLAYGQSYQVSFSQGGQTIQMENNVVHLKKVPFVINVTLADLDGVFVHCSESAVISYNASKRTIPDFQQVANKAGVESEFNADKELFLQDNDRYCYWFYDPQHYDWHRFDSLVKVEGTTVKATKTVGQFFDLILNEPRALQDMKGPVYLTFFSVTGSFKNKTAALAQVEALQLIFED